MPEEFPFAVVESYKIPSCTLIGLNFLDKFGAVIDFEVGRINLGEFDNINIISELETEELGNVRFMIMRMI